MSVSASEPHREYSSRLQSRRSELARLTRQHVGIGNLRLIAAIVFATLVWMSLKHGSISPGWSALPVLVFVGLAIVHEWVIRRKSRIGRAEAFYERCLARLEGRWAGVGETGDQFSSSTHVTAQDLDLFGKGGLFQLLSTARTRMGEETLASWLLSPAPLEAVLDRQVAVADLRGRLDLREDLAVLGETVASGVHPKPLRDWAEEPSCLDSKYVRVILALLPMALALLLIFDSSSGRLSWMSLAVLVAESAMALVFRSRVKRVVLAVDDAARDLGLLSEALARLELEEFQSPRLIQLRSLLETRGAPPSKQIAQLKRLVDWLDNRRNIFMQVIGPPLLYTTQLAFAVEAWRKTSGAQVARWLEAVGEIEALSSLASFAYEHPSYTVPEFSEEGSAFEAAEIGHPLLPESQCVRNDVHLSTNRRVMIISGSNMSGKSTLLRAAGVNAILAMAGAPVCACRLRMSPLTVGASIRTVDSLQSGASRFYAEITRLRSLVDLASGPFPLLFLLDELLHGTNSHDRRIGAEAVIKGLLEKGAIGMVTTHDLALTRIAESLTPPGINVHFQDHLEQGRITFDYRLHPGIVQKSNALELMRSIGLKV